MKYDYYFFEPLEREQALEAFPEWDTKFATAAYNNWLSVFARHASLQYHADLYNHETMLLNAFCKDHGIIADDIYEDYRKEWSAFADAHGLTAHREQTVNLCAVLEDIWERYTADTPFVTNVSALLDRYIARLTDDKPWPTDEHIVLLITREWFNTVVSNNADDEVARLKSMPYPEYLKTPHWRRVRSAMLLAHGARCQSDICQNNDSYWVGGESRIHVHHATYKNRGNERFEDLRLLCDQCHKKWHDTKEDIFSDYMNGVYKYMQAVKP